MKPLRLAPTSSGTPSPSNSGRCRSSARFPRRACRNRCPDRRSAAPAGYRRHCRPRSAAAIRRRHPAPRHHRSGSAASPSDRPGECISTMSALVAERPSDAGSCPSALTSLMTGRPVLSPAARVAIRALRVSMETGQPVRRAASAPLRPSPFSAFRHRGSALAGGSIAADASTIAAPSAANCRPRAMAASCSAARPRRRNCPG